MPRRSKKGGGGSQTEEERLLLQQRRAQTEEEVTRQREEMLTLFLKDKLKKDQRNTEVNLLKINDQWRTILRQSKGAELRGDLMVLSQTFEGHVDILDNIIETLVRELQDAERQCAQARRAHLQNMDELRTQQEKQLMVLQQLWDTNMQELISGFNHDKKVRTDERLRQKQQLQDAAFGAQTRHEAAIEATGALYDKLMASYAAAHHHSLSDSLLSSKENLQRQEDEKLCSCEEKRLEELITTNRQLVQATNEEMKRAKRLQEKLLRLKQKLRSDQLTEEAVQLDLTAKVQQVKQKTRELREQLGQMQKATKKQLLDVTIRSDEASKELQAVVAKGQKVLRMAKLCHQLENKQGVSWFCGEEADPPQVPSEPPELQQLLWRFNSAVLRREALRKHKEDLRQENQQLRLLLRQHLDAATAEGRPVGPQPLCTAYPAPVSTSTQHAVVHQVTDW
ncbi:dynein regulatory complex subunit 2 isoform X2 [Takifugu flavidus]|uniref:Dynein regulatory complex subunit 2 n=1 Tax=Takifugu flavidus TaxID=433684 RepID=A0A5C6NZA2_9TELE|nr:dynein regulatory complex subunit 2 isoform X2 [Takifugu flavidus]TWW72395.1 Coiled-coil domain-containing protein 65 [Takifugu flavidus]